MLVEINRRIKDVAADGHCLYRAIADQSGSTYAEVRKRVLPSWSPTQVTSRLLRMRASGTTALRCGVSAEGRPALLLAPRGFE